ncbi:MAG: HAMP domain-containing histidine kinase, partial [Gammaproteobacteria bacterium]|nr:HAMP domain-containing histidine kinase [Gammaproteobacteria bacterium]
SQREQSLDQLVQYQQIQKTQETLLKADLISFHVVTVLFSDVTEQEMNQVAAYFSTVGEHYQELIKLFPEEADAIRKLERSVPKSIENPGEQYLQRVQLHLAQSKNEIDRLIVANQSRMTQLVQEYRRHNDDLILKTLFLGSIALVLIGSLTTFFFNQLKSDILALLKRTTEIVNGYRGKPLPVNRRDELGELIEGVNSMSQALENREKDLEIERRKSSFHEKMVAIDSLAGGMAHIVGNSTTCISGLIDEISSDSNNHLTQASIDSLNLLQKHVADLALMNQNLSLIDTQQQDKNEWVDINQQLTRIVNLFNFDQRWENVNIELELDRQLPAIFCSATQFNQLIAQLFENSLDALAGSKSPHILITTKAEQNEQIRIVFEDNGEGVSEANLAQIFEPFYTTKPAGQGTGLGLPICWTIVRSMNGSINADSSDQGGLRLTLNLPVSSKTNTQE